MDSLTLPNSHNIHSTLTKLPIKDHVVGSEVISGLVGQILIILITAGGDVCMAAVQIVSQRHKSN